MSHEDELMNLFEVVQLSFQAAERDPDIRRWTSCAQLAGVAAARLGVDGDTFRAAALEGVSIEARRQVAVLEAA